MSKRALFIDRDGTLIVEPPTDFQVDSFEKLTFVPGAITAMSRIASLDYELVMASNQDGLGTESFPEEAFRPVHDLMMRTFEGEGVRFDDVLIDPTMPEEHAPTRKPGIGMFGRYTGGGYDLSACYVIGDRPTDMLLARNLGAKGIFFRPKAEGRETIRENGLDDVCALVTDDWNAIWTYLRAGERTAEIRRTTCETDKIGRAHV